MFGLSLYDLHVFVVMEYVKRISYNILLSASTVLFALPVGTTLLGNTIWLFVFRAGHGHGSGHENLKDTVILIK